MSEETTATSIILDQLWAVFVALQRPIVIRQLIALLLAFVLTWFIAKALKRLLATPLQRLGERRPSLSGIRALFWPALMLIATLLMMFAFGTLNLTAGLVAGWLWLLWLWLAYSLLLLVLYGAWSDDVIRPLHRYIMRPVFGWIIFSTIVGSFIELTALGDIQLFILLEVPITIGGIFKTVVLLYIFYIISWITEPILRRTLAASTEADPGVIHSIITLTRYVIISLGILVALGSLGLSLTSLAFIAGGLSVGIGFGMQDIIANFISGIVLLFEQSLRPGDMVDVDGEFGTVEKLNIRSTVLRTLLNVELIVPNQTFLTSKVRTFTKSDRMIRLRIPVGVGYDSDPEQVRSLLLEAAIEQEDVLLFPEPLVLFNGLGDSSLDFVLVVAIDGPQKMPLVKSDLYFILFKTLTKHDIQIPFPQRDVHLRSGWEQISSNPDFATD